MKLPRSSQAQITAARLRHLARELRQDRSGARRVEIARSLEALSQAIESSESPKRSPGRPGSDANERRFFIAATLMAFFGVAQVPAIRAACSREPRARDAVRQRMNAWRARGYAKYRRPARRELDAALQRAGVRASERARHKFFSLPEPDYLCW